jgi:hypothetical protein
MAAALPKGVTYCFATRQDWLPGLVRVENELDVRFVEHGLYATPKHLVLDRLSTWELLGHARFGNRPLEPIFWIVSRATAFGYTEVPQRKGGVRYSVSFGEGATAVAFQPGGIIKTCLIDGYLGSGEPDENTLHLYDQLRARLFEGFTEISGRLLGPEAMQMLKEGYRLTYSINAPAHCDLRR